MELVRITIAKWSGRGYIGWVLDEISKFEDFSRTVNAIAMRVTWTHTLAQVTEIVKSSLGDEHPASMIEPVVDAVMSEVRPPD